MLNAKLAEDGYAALEAFESVYEGFLSSISQESELAYAKCYGDLKKVRRLAGKLQETLKRTGRPSRFLEAALVAYDYADALALGVVSLSELDRQARVCAAAMQVAREAVQYEFMDGVFGGSAKFDNRRQLAESLIH
jgi:hypothetical protein